MVLALAKWTSANSFKMSIIYSGVAIRDFDMAPAFERSNIMKMLAVPLRSYS